MIAALVLSLIAGSGQAPQADARTLVRQGLEAMGGEARLRTLGSIRITGIGHEYWLGVAEQNDEGPWVTMYQEVNELRDWSAGRIRRTTRRIWEQAPKWLEAVTILDGGVAVTQASGRTAPAGGVIRTDLEEALLLAPERVLLTALDAADLHPVKRRAWQRLAHDVVGFTWRDAQVAVLLNPFTHLPSAVSLRRSYPDDFARSAFGPSEVTVGYGTWQVIESGIWYPRKWTATVNDMAWRDFSVLAVTLNPPAPADSFAIPDSVRSRAAAGAPLTALALNARGAPTEIREGMIGFRDYWTSTMIRQDDGVVILEAHVSAEYTRQLLEEAGRRFPGVPIKALVLTSDPWSHLGGLATFLERRVPVYVVDGSRPLIEAVARRVAPGVKADIRPVSAATELGRGPNRLVLYPVRGEYSERMLMAYFPGHRLLYGTDLLWRRPGPTPTYVTTQATELVRAVRREGLAVDSVFHVHTSTPVAWSEILAAVPAP